MTVVERSHRRRRGPAARKDAVDLVAAEVREPWRMRGARVEVSSEDDPCVASPGEDVGRGFGGVELRALLGPDLRVDIGNPRVAEPHAMHDAALGVGAQYREAVVRAGILSTDQDRVAAAAVGL